ncbi:MAG: glutamate formimidoyltransferase, partial [Ignavibacteriaceae bacterium]
MKIIECVPNFSEGRNEETIDEIKHSLEGIKN